MRGCPAESGYASSTRDATDRVVARNQTDSGTLAIQRYGNTGSGDAADLDLDANGAVVQRTISLGT